MVMPRLSLRPRDPREEHRVATPLELFTDLCYVVAIAQAALQLHHAISEDHVGHGVLFFAIAFFAIWWAWLNFAWFNSAYDHDDPLHRVLTLLQISGSLVLAAGVPRLFEEDFTLIVIGYVVMRVGLVAMWLRAGQDRTGRHATCRRYITGLVAVQLGWVAFLWVPHDLVVPVFLVLALADLAVPFWAEQAGPTPWHPHHIAERYSLMFIIVLGETVLSTTVAIQVAIDGEAIGWRAGLVVVGGLLVVFSAWWLYFSRDTGDVLSADNDVNPFVWGFGHYFIFASGAALGAGLAARVDHYSHHAEIGDVVSSAFVTGPVVVFLVALWAVHLRLHDPSARTWGPLLVVCLALAAVTFVPWSELWAGLLCALLLVVVLRLAGGSRTAT
ncbi:low temperature requirement protein A [Nocardioides sp. JQ2195]|uniref:low temperature requirement protein A n=1 Tax=Nocardioides sp. JQ2195 TaxID=2592334 RepID=UPI00143E4EC2|nr:low temperature requirement protein A [Nocardioides sp. JQ2195]QIX27833.1 low temperature requirement protein A [Nocardioides sp. JQ2195]